MQAKVHTCTIGKLMSIARHDEKGGLQALRVLSVLLANCLGTLSYVYTLSYEYTLSVR